MDEGANNQKNMAAMMAANPWKLDSKQKGMILFFVRCVSKSTLVSGEGVIQLAALNHIINTSIKISLNDICMV